MDAVETVDGAELGTLTRMRGASVGSGANPEFAALLPVLMGATLQAELILIRIIQLPFQGAATRILLAYSVRLDHVLVVLVRVRWLP